MKHALRVPGSALRMAFDSSGRFLQFDWRPLLQLFGHSKRRDTSVFLWSEFHLICTKYTFDSRLCTHHIVFMFHLWFHILDLFTKYFHRLNHRTMKVGACSYFILTFSFLIFEWKSSHLLFISVFCSFSDGSYPLNIWKATKLKRARDSANDLPLFRLRTVTHWNIWSATDVHVASTDVWKCHEKGVN